MDLVATSNRLVPAVDGFACQRLAVSSSAEMTGGGPLLAWLACLLCTVGGAARAEPGGSCLGLVQGSLWGGAEWDAANSELRVQYNDTGGQLSACLASSESNDTVYQVQLVWLGRGEAADCCDLQCGAARLHQQAELTSLLAGRAVTFTHVQASSAAGRRVGWQGGVGWGVGWLINLADGRLRECSMFISCDTALMSDV